MNGASNDRGSRAHRFEGEISCEQVRARLDQLFDSSMLEAETGLDVGSELAVHVTGCQSCSAYLADLRRLSTAIDSLGPEKCPEAVVERVLTAAGAGLAPVAVLEDRSAHPSNVSDAGEGAWNTRWSGLLAAAGILAVAVLGWAAGTRLDLGSAPVGTGASERTIAEVPAHEQARPEQLDVALLVELEAAGYSPEDLERAEQEARLALALLGAVSQRTTLAVDRVLRDRVASAPRRTLERILESKEALDA